MAFRLFLLPPSRISERTTKAKEKAKRKRKAKHCVCIDLKHPSPLLLLLLLVFSLSLDSVNRERMRSDGEARRAGEASGVGIAPLDADSLPAQQLLLPTPPRAAPPPLRPQIGRILFRYVPFSTSNFLGFLAPPGFMAVMFPDLEIAKAATVMELKMKIEIIFDKIAVEGGYSISWYD